ncbi:hypothetical protein BMT54_06970 [Pasteurellaceae bacterium 15-036681]|nr:hypothetical protein BMT54_06970 [Pasteurellaceae bacterium 15-036681]
MKTTQQILQEREQQHGSYDRFCEIYGKFRQILADYGKDLTTQQRISLEMQCFKQSRILNKGADHTDTWQDIAGYAQLGSGWRVGDEVDNALPKPIETFKGLNVAYYLNSNNAKYSILRISPEEFEIWQDELNGRMMYKSKEDVITVIELLTGKQYQG